MRFGARTDPGRARANNQDAYGCRGPLFLVADGMGGHRGGEVASRIAVEQILVSDLDADPLAGLRAGFIAANQAIRDHAEAHEECRGMGTTVAALVLAGPLAYIAHIGDSRVYRRRHEALTILTRDHSLVGELVRQGSISPDEARNHPQRSVLTRALGTDGEPRVEFAEVDLAAGDLFLLCTDGLTAELTDEEIGTVLSGPGDPQAKAESLVDLAVRKGGSDNITAIVVEP